MGKHRKPGSHRKPVVVVQHVLRNRLLSVGAVVALVGAPVGLNLVGSQQSPVRSLAVDSQNPVQRSLAAARASRGVTRSPTPWDERAALHAVPVAPKVAIQVKERMADRRTRQVRDFSGIDGRIRRCESGGNYQAVNRWSSASGAYQFLDSTWHTTTGLRGRARDYSRATQDAAFWKLWDHGRGAHNWAASRSCWG